jgi:hypothetical protein
MLPALGITTAACTAGVLWLLRSLVQKKITEGIEKYKSQLSSDLESTKADLLRDVNHKKAEIEGDIKKAVETHLGQLAAQRQYEYEARKRLYTAIGSLRFQLLLACRDLTRRIEGYSKHQYPTSINTHYGRSTLYRILRPIAIAELIEQQIALADFSVDADAVDCLRFRKSATQIWSRNELVCGYEKINWDDEHQHVFAESISISANSLIKREPNTPDRMLRYDEYVKLLDSHNLTDISSFRDLLKNFDIEGKPILWVRLIAYANSCNHFVTKVGSKLGFADEVFSTRSLLDKLVQEDVRKKIPEFEEKIVELQLVSL